MNDLEIRSSIFYINDILDDLGYDYDYIESSELNGNGHIYDWKVENTNKFIPTRRKFWVIKKEQHRKIHYQYEN